MEQKNFRSISRLHTFGTLHDAPQSVFYKHASALLDADRSETNESEYNKAKQNYNLDQNLLKIARVRSPSSYGKIGLSAANCLIAIGLSISQSSRSLAISRIWDRALGQNRSTHLLDGFDANLHLQRIIESNFNLLVDR